MQSRLSVNYGSQADKKEEEEERRRRERRKISQDKSQFYVSVFHCCDTKKVLFLCKICFLVNLMITIILHISENSVIVI